MISSLKKGRKKLVTTLLCYRPPPLNPVSTIWTNKYQLMTISNPPFMVFPREGVNAKYTFFCLFRYFVTKPVFKLLSTVF